jgi:hypothetical protein
MTTSDAKEIKSLKIYRDFLQSLADLILKLTSFREKYVWN